MLEGLESLTQTIQMLQATPRRRRCARMAFDEKAQDVEIENAQGAAEFDLVQEMEPMQLEVGKDRAVGVETVDEAVGDGYVLGEIEEEGGRTWLCLETWGLLSLARRLMSLVSSGWYWVVSRAVVFSSLR